MSLNEEESSSSRGRPTEAKKRAPASPKELKVLRECLSDAIWLRALPMATLAGASMYYLVRTGRISPGKKYGPWPKVAVAATVAYWAGKLEYLLGDGCKNKFLREAPNDEIAYHIRNVRGLPQPEQAEEKFGKRRIEETKLKATSEKPKSFIQFIVTQDLSDEERRVLNECRKCANGFSYSLCVSIPLSFYLLQHFRMIRPIRFLGKPSKIPLLVLGMVIGLVSGQLVYWYTPDCPQHFLKKLPNSNVSEFIRNRKQEALESMAKEKLPHSTEKNISAVLAIDPSQQQSYLTPTGSVENNKVLRESKFTTKDDLIERGIKEGILKFASSESKN